MEYGAAARAERHAPKARLAVSAAQAAKRHAVMAATTKVRGKFAAVKASARRERRAVAN